MHSLQGQIRWGRARQNLAIEHCLVLFYNSSKLFTFMMFLSHPILIQQHVEQILAPHCQPLANILAAKIRPCMCIKIISAPFNIVKFSIYDILR
jgi:hypothetical protein